MSDIATVKTSRKKWGIPSILLGYVTFFAVQLVFYFILLGVYMSQHQDELMASANGDTSGLTSKITKYIVEPVPLVSGMILMYGTWMLWMFLVSKMRGSGSWVEDFKFRFKKFDILWGIFFAILCQIGLALFLLLIKAIFPHANYSGMDNSSIFTNQHGGSKIFILIAIVSIAGPFFEELFFRGFILQGFRNASNRILAKVEKPNKGSKFFARYSNFLCILATAIIFGATHTQGVSTFGQILVPISTGLIGLVLGIISIKTNRLGINIFTHMSFNAISVLLPIILH